MVARGVSKRLVLAAGAWNPAATSLDRLSIGASMRKGPVLEREIPIKKQATKIPILRVPVALSILRAWFDVEFQNRCAP